MKRYRWTHALEPSVASRHPELLYKEARSEVAAVETQINGERGALHGSEAGFLFWAERAATLEGEKESGRSSDRGIDGSPHKVHSREPFLPGVWLSLAERDAAPDHAGGGPRAQSNHADRSGLIRVDLKRLRLFRLHRDRSSEYETEKTEREESESKHHFPVWVGSCD